MKKLPAVLVTENVEHAYSQQIDTTFSICSFVMTLFSKMLVKFFSSECLVKHEKRKSLKLFRNLQIGFFPRLEKINSGFLLCVICNVNSAGNAFYKQPKPNDLLLMARDLSESKLGQTFFETNEDTHGLLKKSHFCILAWK